MRFRQFFAFNKENKNRFFIEELLDKLSPDSGAAGRFQHGAWIWHPFQRRISRAPCLHRVALASRLSHFRLEKLFIMRVTYPTKCTLSKKVWLRQGFVVSEGSFFGEDLFCSARDSLQKPDIHSHVHAQVRWRWEVTDEEGNVGWWGILKFLMDRADAQTDPEKATAGSKG